MITNYRKAWIDFRKSEEYKQACDMLKQYGVKQRYASNILRSAFEAGWGNRKIYFV